MRDDRTEHDDDTLMIRSDEEGLYLPVAESQVPQIQVLFDGVALPYTLQENSTNITTIRFGPDVTAEEVQSLLDHMH